MRHRIVYRFTALQDNKVILQENFQIGTETDKSLIFPLSLQILYENCRKHFAAIFSSFFSFCGCGIWWDYAFEMSIEYTHHHEATHCGGAIWCRSVSSMQCSMSSWLIRSRVIIRIALLPFQKCLVIDPLTKTLRSRSLISPFLYRLNFRTYK